MVCDTDAVGEYPAFFSLKTGYQPRETADQTATDKVPLSSDYSGTPVDGSPQEMNGADLGGVVRSGTSLSESMNVAYRWYHYWEASEDATVTLRCVR